MKILFAKVQTAIVNEIIVSFENEKDSWKISNHLILKDTRILTQGSKLLGNILENVVYFHESDFQQTIGISFGAGQIVTHIHKSEYGGNETFELLEQAFNELWIHVSSKSKKIPQQKKSSV